MNVKLMVVAGPPSAGKTAVIKNMIRHLQSHMKVAYLKVDVVVAFEDEELKEEFGIPTKKVYSGDLCPDHMGIMVVRDALEWAEEQGADVLIYESAGLCLRCTPYITASLGICVISALSGTHAPLKMAPMIALSDVCIVTKTDLISQAEKEVFRESIRKVSPGMDIVETNAVQGTGLRYLFRLMDSAADIGDASAAELRGIPPLGVCTVCIGKNNIGWQNHFGVIRRMDDADNIYRGE
ncbi:MAG: cobalamin biosynthesis protein [Candidatus Methanoplasma sp.]|jgi:Ni2+-binding GTPase involved in maturation of urease and hydrogenase|nr:cobalamin biosynthesis protein [Candidatus Methanoplasma sp.]